MAFEERSVILPPLFCERAIRLETIDGAVAHEQGVVRVVMGKKPLATERKQPVYLPDPAIQGIKIDFIASLINRIRLPETPGCNFLDGRSNWDCSRFERPAYQLRQIAVAH